MAKLGDTVSIRIQMPFDPSSEMYWNEFGYPCDRYGSRLGIDRIVRFVLDTKEKVDNFNSTHPTHFLLD